MHALFFMAHVAFEENRERMADERRVCRATRKNSQLAPAQRVAMKMDRRLRCASVTYRFRYMLPPCALPAAHFDRNELPLISGTGH